MARDLTQEFHTDSFVELCDAICQVTRDNVVAIQIVGEIVRPLLAFAKTSSVRRPKLSFVWVPVSFHVKGVAHYGYQIRAHFTADPSACWMERYLSVSLALDNAEVFAHSQIHHLQSLAGVWKAKEINSLHSSNRKECTKRVYPPK